MSISGPEPQREFFVQLALVKKDKLNADDKLTDKFLYQTLHGFVDDICKKKVPIDLNTLFGYKKGKKIEKILVEGAPGIGKTRLACYLCSKWAEGELLQHYEVVILVPLRRFQLGKHSTEKLDIQDVIELYFKSKKANKACEKLSNNGCSNTLIILEGWDELDPFLRQKNSFFHDIIAGSAPQFYNASVIVTSRPTVSDTLYKYMDKRIEVLGFDSEHIDKYIASHIPDKKEMVVSRLQKYPNIRALAHIPLTLTIMCDIVQDKGYIPLTLTELYDLYILNSLLFWLNRAQPSTCTHLHGLSSPSDLPVDESKVFKALSNLALNGFLKDRFVFRRKHLQKVGLPIDSDHAFDGYGLLNPVPCQIKAGHDLFYQFLHLTVQEYLAAYSLLGLDQNRRLEILEELRLKKNFRVVCRFYSGLTKLSDDAAKENIIYNTRKNNNEDLLLLLHCLYEVQDPRICQEAALHLDRKLKLDNKSLNETDCLCLAYTVVNAGGSWDLSMRLCNIGSHGLDTFYSYLRFHQESLRNSVSFSKLDLAHNLLHLKNFTASSSTGVELSSIIKGPFTIENFVLDSNELGDEQIEVLARAMCSNKTISALSLSRCDVSAVGAKYLAKMLYSNNTLKGLFLRWNGIGDDGVAHLAAALKQNSTLLELMIGNNDINERGLILLCEMLNVNTGLKELRIENTNIRGCECLHITSFLENNRHLEVLNLSRSGIGDEGVAAIANGIMKYPDCALRRFSFFACEISDNSVEVLCELMEKGLLVSLQLGCNSEITDKSVPRFVRALEKTTTLKRLRLENCGIAYEDSKQQLLAFNQRGIDITFALDSALKPGAPKDQIESIKCDGSTSSPHQLAYKFF